MPRSECNLKWLGKAIASCVLFLLASGALFLSKSSTLLILSQLRRDKKEAIRCVDKCEREELLEENEDARPAWFWCLLLVMTVPHMITFIRSTILMITKKEELSQNLLPTLRGQSSFDWLCLFLQPLASFIQMIGLCVLFLIAFPEIASSKVSLITCCTAFFPGVIKALGRQKLDGKVKFFLHLILDILAVGLQLAALAYFTYSIWESHSKPWTLPLGLLLSSAGWWTVWLPSYRSDESDPSEERDSCLKRLAKKIDSIENSDYECVMDVVTSLVKIVAAFTFFLVHIQTTEVIETYRFKLEYKSKADIIFKPGSPPPRLLNETFVFPLPIQCDGYSTRDAHGDKNAINLDVYANASIAFPDSNDCSAYWLWDCAFSLRPDHEAYPSLNYTICPANQYFNFNEPSLRCIYDNNCCVNMTDGWRETCGERKAYETCINKRDETAVYSLPSDMSEVIKCGRTGIQKTTTTPPLTTSSTTAEPTTKTTAALLPTTSSNLPSTSTLPGCPYEEQYFDWSVHSKAMLTSTIYPVALLFVQILSSLFAYSLCYLACSSTVDWIGFALPVQVSQILVIASLALMCGQRQADACMFSTDRGGIFPAGIFFSCGTEDYLDYLFLALSFLAQLWISSHIWTTSSWRLDQNVFFDPLYESVLLEQSMMFTRKKNRKFVKVDEKKIFGCATMWHETKEEMKSLLQSALRMDKHSRRDNDTAGDHKYAWELHIFFDDAFLEGGKQVNNYVLTLFEAMHDVHIDKRECLRMCQKENNATTGPEFLSSDLEMTGYGRRITYTLEKKTKLVCHLKDKAKIRHKKRWSQCMYMEYFYRQSELYKKENILKSNDTFLLALDGDIDFKPEAVTRLLDVMIKNENIGAACGRIHPTGTGIIAWYQKFEYAVGHWFQKSTEDALGNVLCSPGCFSLFRLKALCQNNIVDNMVDKWRNHLFGKETMVEKNIEKYSRKLAEKEDLDKTAMEKYSTKTRSGWESIQYDQGEDRWLCTLLIIRGWEVEYVASSHSFTACPDSFDEFYNQRRRWTPSTLANQWDLFAHSWVLLKYGNTNIVHMFYLIIMLMAGFLGPGSVFLMLVGGLRMVSSMDLWASFALNAALITTFFMVSLFCRQELQLLVAKVLSLLYACIMIMIMFVLILEAITLRDSCWLTPATTTLIIVASAYLFAGLLHLFQVFDLLHGFVYYLTIPAMYMLLPFYCVFNLTDPSWGTRENVEGGQKSNSSWLQRLLGINNNEKVTSRNAETQTQEPETTHDNADSSEERQIPGSEGSQVLRSENRDVPRSRGEEVPNSEVEGVFRAEVVQCEVQSEQGEVPRTEEEDIWKPICKKLSPLDTQAEGQTKRSRQEDIKLKIEKDLETLKVNSLLIFLFLNIAFVFGIFLMQIRFESLNRFSQDWRLCKLSTPLDALLLQNDTLTNSTIAPLQEDKSLGVSFAGELSKETTYMQLDPINMVFIVFFLGVMFFQMAGMIFHRVRNAGHLMATISWSSSSSLETTADPRNQTETANDQTIQPSQQQTIQPSQQLSTSVSYHA